MSFSGLAEIHPLESINPFNQSIASSFNTCSHCKYVCLPPPFYEFCVFFHTILSPFNSICIPFFHSVYCVLLPPVFCPISCLPLLLPLCSFHSIRFTFPIPTLAPSCPSCSVEGFPTSILTRRCPPSRVYLICAYGSCDPTRLSRALFYLPFPALFHMNKPYEDISFGSPSFRDIVSCKSRNISSSGTGCSEISLRRSMSMPMYSDYGW